MTINTFLIIRIQQIENSQLDSNANCFLNYVRHRLAAVQCMLKYHSLYGRLHCVVSRKSDKRGGTLSWMANSSNKLIKLIRDYDNSDVWNHSMDRINNICRMPIWDISLLFKDVPFIEKGLLRLTYKKLTFASRTHWEEVSVQHHHWRDLS